MLAHWRLTPKQLKELSEEDLDVLNMSYRLYEKRWLESFSDLIGSLTGTSWSVDSLTADPVNTDLEDFGFTWRKKPTQQKIALPLTLVVGGNKILENVKKAAFSMKQNRRKDPSILNVATEDMLKEAEVIDLSKVSKKDFLNFAAGV